MYTMFWVLSYKRWYGQGGEAGEAREGGEGRREEEVEGEVREEGVEEVE